MARNLNRAVDWSLSVNDVARTGGSLSFNDDYDRANPFDLATGSHGAGVLSAILVDAGDVVKLALVTTSTYGEFTGVDLNVRVTPIPEPSSFLCVGLVALMASVVAAHLRPDSTNVFLKSSLQ